MYIHCCYLPGTYLPILAPAGTCAVVTACNLVARKKQMETEWVPSPWSIVTAASIPRGIEHQQCWWNENNPSGKLYLRYTMFYHCASIPYFVGVVGAGLEICCLLLLILPVMLCYNDTSCIYQFLTWSQVLYCKVHLWKLKKAIVGQWWSFSPGFSNSRNPELPLLVRSSWNLNPFHV